MKFDIRGLKHNLSWHYIIFGCVKVIRDELLFDFRINAPLTMHAN